MSSDEVQTGFSMLRGDVAIIGMDCIFPSAPDINVFWQNIVSKVDAITDVPPDRWDPEIYFDPDSTSNDRVYCKRGGYLGQTQFNPLNYGIMPNAVHGGDPSQFLALKIAYQALENAGYLNQLENRERVEVILGRGNFLDPGSGNAVLHSTGIEQGLELLSSLHPEHTQEDLEAIKKDLKATLPNFGPDNVPSLMPNITTGRIANRLGLMGPNFTVDAACASALIATELGIYDLLNRKCDLALVGGIFMLPDVLFPIIFCQLRALSQQSQIRPFDKNADGTIIGEGVGTLILKRLEDAERDGDIIYAVIKGIGTSSDGRASSVTAPRVEGEELALKRAYEMSGVSPQTIELIEAHGTGTPIGDRAEIEALTRVFGTRGESYPWCALGTVKSMIGHTMHAAGAAGLIKAALAIYNKVLPPTLHCDEPHPALEQTPFYINSEARPWIHGAQDAPRRAGISAFGFGGINAHIVLEEYPSTNENKASNHLLHWDTEVCILQGQSRQSLIQRAQQLEQYLEVNPKVPLKDLAYTLNTTLDDMPYILATVASSPEDFKRKLQYSLQHLSDTQCTEIKDIRGIYFFEKPVSKDRKLAFMFPGDGSQYVGMLSDLCIHFPEVRACFDELDAAFIPQQRNYLPSQIIFPLSTFTKAEKLQLEERIWPISTAVGAVFTANKALFTLLTHLQLQPDVILGHSTGEISALFASEIVELGLQHICEFGPLYERLVAEAGIPELNTVAVEANYELVSAIVDKIDGNIYITMDNSPRHVVVFGEPHAMEQAINELQSRGINYEKLPINRAYHTPLFRAANEYFRQFFYEQHIRIPTIEMWSCVTGQPYPQDIAEIQKLAIDSCVRPVKFKGAIEAMYAAGVRIFVEVGPRDNLTTFVDDTLQGYPHLAVSSNVPNQSGTAQLNHLVGVLAAQGIAMRLDNLYARRAPRRLSLDEAHIPDTKDSTTSMMLPLAMPSLKKFSLKRSTKETDATQTNFEATTKPHLTMPSAPSPIVSQEPKDGFAPEVSQWLEKTALKEYAIAVEGDISGVSLQAMEDYFQTMQHFLEVQQRVMQAYLTRGHASQKQGQGSVDQPIAVKTPQKVDTEEPSVCPPPELEKSQPEGIAEVSLQSLTQTVLNVVSERTGYPTEVLNLDMDMEAELGIDSIKRIEILGSFQDKFPLLEQKQIDIGQLIEQVGGLRTLQQVIDFLRERLGPSETPMIPTPSHPGELDVSGTEKATLEEHPSSKVSGISTETQPFLFNSNIISYIPNQELVIRRQIDLSEDIFLNDHTIGSYISAADETLKLLCPVPASISMEMMAEVASRLMPGKLLIGMKDIKVHRWILVEGEKPKTIQISARKQTADEKEVVVGVWDIRESTEHESIQSSPHVEGTMVFGDTYPDSPPVEPFSLQTERLPKYSAEQMYKEKLMFHGPQFQGLVLLDRLGEDGIVGQVEALPNTELFRSNPNPQFITDPFLIDAVSQLAAYWPLEYLETDFNVYPIRLKALHLYGPKPCPSERFRSQVRIRQVTSRLLSADIDVIGVDDCIRMRLIGWESWRAHGIHKLPNLLSHPTEVSRSVLWDTPILKFPALESFQCYRLDISGPDQAILKQLWVQAMLSQQEKETWRNLKERETRQTKWLSGKVAAKDALIMFLKAHHGIELSPADIEITADEHGRPVPQGAWTEHVPVVPALSITHTDGLAAVLVGNCANDQRIGIDVELLRQNMPGFDRLAFAAEEQSLLNSLDESSRQEWMTRFWCAKEAVAKALGRGLTEGPQSLAVQQINTQTGVIYLSLRGKLAEMFPEFASSRIVAYTAREEDYIIACSLCEGE